MADASGIQPNISLGIQTPQIGGSGGLQGGLGVIGDFAKIQNELNQARLFNQTFQAKQLAGRIMSQSPDMETAIKQMFADPRVAPFAPEIVNNLRQTQQTLLVTQGERARQAQTGMQALIKSLSVAAGDPSKFEESFDRGLSEMSPAAREDMAGPLANMKKVWGDAARNDPRRFLNNMQSAMTSADMSSDAIKMIMGTPGEINQGSQIQPILRAGPGGNALSGPGGIVPTGPAFSIGRPPDYAPNENVPRPALGPGGLQPNGLGGSAISGQPAGTTRAVAPEPVPAAGDGKPLYDEKSIQAPVNELGRDVTGKVRLNEQQQGLNKGLEEDYKTGTKQFHDAAGVLGSAVLMEHSFNQMARTGGLLQPGAFAAVRTEFAKIANLVANITGTKLPFDAETIGSIESLNKQTNTMGAQLTTSLLPQQREAAETIRRMTSSVPGADNTYVGSKLLLAGLKQIAQRVIDERRFDNKWIERNQGVLFGSDTAFQETHKAEDYAERALSSVGMNKEGKFQSTKAVGDLMRQGLLTRSEAENILKTQFGIKE